MGAYRRYLAAAALVLLAGAAPAPRYGDRLAAAALRRDHRLAGLHLAATGRDGAAIDVAAGAAPAAEPAAADRAVLRDAMGRAIGTLTIVSRNGAPADAAAVAAFLARRTYTAAGLAEPDPFVAGTAPSVRGQALVERTLAAFPDLVTLALHVAVAAPPGRIVASSFGRIGKADDADDTRVTAEGAVLREVTDGGARLAVELPLLDRAGRTIGALSTSFAVPAGADPQSAAPRAALVQAALARGIPARRWLAR